MRVSPPGRVVSAVQAERAAGLLEVREVEHHAVEAQRAGLRVRGEGIDDLARVLELGWRRREGFVDRARPGRGGSRSFRESRGAARCGTRRPGRSASRKSACSVSIAGTPAAAAAHRHSELASTYSGDSDPSSSRFADRADRGRQVLGAPGDAGQTRHVRRVARHRQHRLRGFGGDRHDAHARRQASMHALPARRGSERDAPRRRRCSSSAA